MPWWGMLSSLFAPVLLIGGWTVAAHLQPVPFDAVSRSISSLAAEGMPYRWLITIALLGVGACNVITGLALRPAAEAGRLLLIIGGVCGMLIAVNPQPGHGVSVPHVVISVFAVVLMTIWPVAAIRREPGAPYGLRPAVAWTAVLVNLGLLLWFTAELFNGSELGLAERAVTADQSAWPFVVVLTVLAARGSGWPARTFSHAVAEPVGRLVSQPVRQLISQAGSPDSRQADTEADAGTGTDRYRTPNCRQ